MVDQATQLITSLGRVATSIRVIRRLVDDAIPRTCSAHPLKTNILNETTAALKECCAAVRAAQCLHLCLVDDAKSILNQDDDTIAIADRSKKWE